MRIAVLAPMASELRPVVRALRLERAELPGGASHRGTAGDARAEVVAARVGVGPTASAEAAARLVEALAPDHVVVVGITGGVHPDAEVGALVAPAQVVDGASGRVHVPTPVPGSEPSGALWTTDEVIRDHEQLAELHCRGVVALDMETAAVAEVCDAADVPWSVVRAISDLAHDATVDDALAGLVRPDGSPDLARVARHVARHPAQAPGLARLGRDVDRATRAAARAAAEACDRLAEGATDR